MFVTQRVKPKSRGRLRRLVTLPGAFRKREVTMCLVHTYCEHTSTIQTHTEKMGEWRQGKDGAYKMNKRRK